MYICQKVGGKERKSRRNSQVRGLNLGAKKVAFVLVPYPSKCYRPYFCALGIHRVPYAMRYNKAAHPSLFKQGRF